MVRKHKAFGKITYSVELLSSLKLTANATRKNGRVETERVLEWPYDARIKK